MLQIEPTAKHSTGPTLHKASSLRHPPWSGYRPPTRARHQLRQYTLVNDGILRQRVYCRSTWRKHLARLASCATNPYCSPSAHSAHMVRSASLSYVAMHGNQVDPQCFRQPSSPFSESTGLAIVSLTPTSWDVSGPNWPAPGPAPSTVPTRIIASARTGTCTGVLGPCGIRH